MQTCVYCRRLHVTGFCRECRDLWVTRDTDDTYDYIGASITIILYNNNAKE